MRHLVRPGKDGDGGHGLADVQSRECWQGAQSSQLNAQCSTLNPAVTRGHGEIGRWLMPSVRVSRDWWRQGRWSFVCFFPTSLRQGWPG